MQNVNQIIGEVSIYYQRQERQWVVENGRVLATFDRGKVGQEAAKLEAVRHENGELYSLIRQVATKQPILSSRATKAAVLIINGHVHPPRSGNQINEVAQVKSQTGVDSYSIQYRNTFVCGCDDFQFGKAPDTGRGQRFCKHILALLLAKRLCLVDWDIEGGSDNA